MSSIAQIDPALFERIVSMRRDLHRHPELSGKEYRTQGQIKAFLDELGISYRPIADTGLLAEIPGQFEDAPRVALRADIDALPIGEETGLPFSSETEGVMHACGHDGHTSILLGAAALLVEDPPPQAPVRLLFQPAEEIGKGARMMMKEGALENVAMIFGGHIDRHYPLGTIIVSDGPVNASSDCFKLSIGGKGGHAARPHETVDAVVVGSLLVMAIQTIVSREVNPAHPSVVTVGRFDAGTAANVIAAHAHLEGTIRAQDPEVRNALHDSIRRVSGAIGQLHGAQIDLEILRGTPPVINPPELAELCREAAIQAVGESSVRKLEVANMGAEDFGYYMEAVPGCYVRFGTTVEGVEPHPAHSSEFDFDERVLGIGARYYHSLVRVASQCITAGLQS